MRTLKRNQQTFWFCQFKGIRVPGDTANAGIAIAGVSVVGDEEQEIDYIYDEYGNETGEYIRHYSEPVEMRANISPATGLAQTEQFGNLENYDKVIVTDWMECPIDENSVLFIDKEPEFTTVTTHDVSEGDTLLGGDNVVERTYSIPKYDYIVRRVAKSLNSISIAVGKVKVS